MLVWQKYNLVSLAFYLGKQSVVVVWPSLYADFFRRVPCLGIPYGVHLSEAEGTSSDACTRSPSLTASQGREVPGSQHHRLGYYPHVPRCGFVLRGILRVTFLVRCVMTSLLINRSNSVVLGMCESCVAPILILIISMFYKKNEQVCGPLLVDTRSFDKS